MVCECIYSANMGLVSSVRRSPARASFGPNTGLVGSRDRSSHWIVCGSVPLVFGQVGFKVKKADEASHTDPEMASRSVPQSENGVLDIFWDFLGATSIGSRTPNPTH